MPQPLAYTLLVAFAPAPAPVIDALQELEIETSVEDAGIVRLKLGIGQREGGDWELLAEDLFKPGVPLAVRIQAGAGIPTAVINAFVSRQAVTWPDEPGGTVLEVTGLDATALMNLEEQIQPWPNMPDSFVAAAIFGKHGLVPLVDPTSPVLTEPEGTLVQRETDIRFLRRLAVRNGFDCYVQPEPLTGIDQGFFRKPQLNGLPDAVLSVSMGPQTNVHRFRVSYDTLKPTRAIAAGVDTSTRAPQPAVAPVSLERPLGLEPTLLRSTTAGLVRPAGTGLQRSGDLQTFAQAIVDRSSWALVAEGDPGPDVKVLRPGGIVNIRGAGRVYSGSWYVTRVRHAIGPQGWKQHFEARRNAVGLTGGELFVEVA